MTYNNKSIQKKNCRNRNSSRSEQGYLQRPPRGRSR